ncbi:MAG: hypothetical protein KKG75_00505 [Nanoarchaeota archaeon]|nr:hypothetical protein [Nanoarchaeota archaeon]
MLFEENKIIWDSEFKTIKHIDLVNWFKKIPKKWINDIPNFYVKYLWNDPEINTEGFFSEDEDKYVIYLKEISSKKEIKYVFYHEVGHLIWRFLSKKQKDEFIANIDECDILQAKDCLRKNPYWDYEQTCKNFYNEIFAWKFAESMENEGKRI